MQRIVRRAAIQVLHKDKGARQGRPEVPGKTPNGLSTDVYPIGCTIEIFPFVGEHIEAGNLVLFDLPAVDIDAYGFSSHGLLLRRPICLSSD